MLPSILQGTILALSLLASPGHAGLSTPVTQPLGFPGTPLGQIRSDFYERSSGLLDSRSLTGGLCDPSKKLCENKACAPDGYTCCNDGTGDACCPNYECFSGGCCKIGTKCNGPITCLGTDIKCGNHCMPKDATCCNTATGTFCTAGKTCDKGGASCNVGSDDGGSSGSGSADCSGTEKTCGSTCIPADATCCDKGLGRYCDAGYECDGAFFCNEIDSGDDDGRSSGGSSGGSSSGGSSTSAAVPSSTSKASSSGTSTSAATSASTKAASASSASNDDGGKKGDAARPRPGILVISIAMALVLCLKSLKG